MKTSTRNISTINPVTVGNKGNKLHIYPVENSATVNQRAPCTVNKKNWDTKEDKIGISQDEATLNSEKGKPLAFSLLSYVCFAKGIS